MVAVLQRGGQLRRLQGLLSPSGASWPPWRPKLRAVLPQPPPRRPIATQAREIALQSGNRARRVEELVGPGPYLSRLTSDVNESELLNACPLVRLVSQIPHPRGPQRLA